jgi:hypothetical protein
MGRIFRDTWEERERKRKVKRREIALGLSTLIEEGGMLACSLALLAGKREKKK